MIAWKRVVLGMGLLLMLGMAGCGNDADTDAGEEEGGDAQAAKDRPAPGGWVVGRLGAEPPHLNILLDTADASAVQLTDVVFESLLHYDYETVELVPLLAESVEESDDHLVYTFTIKPEASFSDGEPVTAEDVVFTYNAVMDPAHETMSIRNYLQYIETAEVVDERTVRFTCKQPYFKNLESIGTMPIYPEHIYGVGDFNTHDNNRSPIGSGPYVFEEWKTNQQISFRRNENYWNADETPYLERQVYKVITDDNSAFQVLTQGQIDYMGLRPEQWENQAQSPRFTDQFHNFQYDAASGYVSGYSYIGWNLRRPQFEDKRVRQALTMLLDRDLMLETIWYGLGEVVSGPSPIGTEAYDDSIVPWPFDPEGANALLDEAGWVDSDGDGVRDKDGVDLAFDFLMVSGSSEVEQMLTVYQEELKRAGIDMQIRPLEWATFLENIQRREFSAVTLAWAIPPDQDPYQVWHSSQAEAGSNHVGYINPETDKILEKARTTFDKDERYAMYREFHRIIHQDQPYTFLFHRKVLAAVNKRFENVQVYDMGLRPREWWVPKSLQRYP